MARTQAADYDQKLDLITQKAAELFATKGFAAASVSDLAARCKISKSLIYHYYSSKEAILYDVMSEHMDTLTGLVCIKNTTNVSPKTQFREVTKDLLQCYIGAANHQKILLYELQSLPQAQQKEIIAKQRAVIKEIEKLLSLTQSTSKIKIGRAKLRAKVMLYFGMMNWTHTWFNSTGRISRNELAEEIADTTLRSLT